MKPLGGSYKRDGDRVYWQGDRLKNVRADQFRYLGSYWATNGVNVFSNGRIERGADLDTFTVLNRLYAKDRDSVYYLGGTVHGVDVPTFEVLDSATYFESPGARGLGHAGFARDQNRVFHYSETIGKPAVVRSADRNTFRSLGGVFGLDKSCVFIDHRQIRGARPESWFRLGGIYSRDAHSVFYDNAMIRGADAETFICLWNDIGTWAKDKNGFYDCGRVSSQEHYLEQLIEYAEYLNRVAESISSGKL